MGNPVGLAFFLKKTHFLFCFVTLNSGEEVSPKLQRQKFSYFFLVSMQNSNFSVLQSRTNIGKQNIFCSSSTIVEQYVRRASYFKRNFHLMFQAYGDVGCGVSSLGIQNQINFCQKLTSQKEIFILFDFQSVMTRLEKLQNLDI